MPHLPRALGNLAQVFRKRARDEKLEKKIAHQLVDMLDEWARRIERV